jgi:hypothetical protein
MGLVFWLISGIMVFLMSFTVPDFRTGYWIVASATMFLLGCLVVLHGMLIGRQIDRGVPDEFALLYANRRWTHRVLLSLEALVALVWVFAAASAIVMP